MKRHRFVNAAVLALLASAGREQPLPAQVARIAFVQSASAIASPNATTLAVPFPAANTAGNLIVATVSFDTGPGTTWNCTDSQGNAYTKAIFQNDSRHAQGMGICFAPNVKAGVNTFTAALGASTCCRRVTVHEYSGAATALPLDRTASATGVGTAVTSPSLTTTQDGELIFAALDKDSSNTPTVAAGSTYTLRQAALRSATEDRVQTTAGATTATFSLSASTDVILAVATFKARGGETTPPVVALTAPATAALLTGTAVTVSATATDNVAVAGVQFLLDGVNLGAEDTTSPYSVTWNTTTASDGPHALSARARDTSNNQATATSVGVTVDNTPPTGSVVINGGAAATSAVTATLTLSAADSASAVTQMRFSNTGTSFSAPEVYATSKSWALAGTPGTQTVFVQFLNAAGLWSAPFTDTIVLTTEPDTTAPSQPLGLTANAASSSAIALSWTASTDNTGVTGYTVQRNGIAIGTTASTTYTDTGLAANTAYVYAVAAYDAAGNVSTFSDPASATTLNGPYTPLYPLKASANNRYLVDQNNVPFMMVGNDAQGLIGRITDAESDFFLADRKARGFNALWVDLLCFRCFGDGRTVDGIVPFTTPGDISTPNEAYFARVDTRVRQAAGYGLTVLLNPAETIGTLTLLRTNGVAKNRAYGQYLGNRYKSFDNIIWLNGNDLQTWPNAADDAVVQAVALGIKDVDTRHLHTVELNFLTSGSLDDPTWQPIIGLDAAYTYFATYDQVLKEYNRPNFMPVFMVEANYEGEQNAGELATSYVLRLQEYWTMLSGATGQLYGNHFIWQFIPGWQTALDTPGALHFGTYLRTLFDTRPWYNLVPDQNHTVVTAGFGTYINTNPFGGNNYVTAGRTPDGALVMAYLPKIQVITVDMSRMASAAVARWFDPTSGTYATIAGSPLANAGSRQFVPPGPNRDGDPDWVLVIEATAPDGTPPSVPGNLTATAVSPVRINLGWSASSDNVAVAGYAIFRDGAQIATTTTPGYADVGVSAQTTYTYTVTAFDFTNNASGSSTAVTATTPAPDNTPPTVPANLQAFGGPASVTLTWSASIDNVSVAGYRVYRNGVIIASTPQTSLTDSGLAAGTTFLYALDSFDFAGNISAVSPAISVTTSTGPQPIAAYAFDETSGTTTADSSGNGITGTLTNGPVRVAGHSGNGLSFDGVNDHVNLGNPPGLQLTGSMTISAWVFETADPVDDGQIIAKSDNRAGWQFKSSPDTGVRTFAISISDPAVDTIHVQRYSRTVRALNTWYHVAGVYNAAARTLDIYVNGVLDNGVMRGGAIPATQANNAAVNVTIGQRAGGFAYNIKGILDNVRVYNVALTPAQVQADMIRP